MKLNEWSQAWLCFASPLVPCRSEKKCDGEFQMQIAWNISSFIYLCLNWKWGVRGEAKKMFNEKLKIVEKKTVSKCSLGLTLMKNCSESLWSIEQNLQRVNWKKFECLFSFSNVSFVSVHFYISILKFFECFLSI